MAKYALTAIFVAVGWVVGLTNFAKADTFLLSNNNGGDGYVTPNTGGIPFDLFGADNGAALGFGANPNYTNYFATALTDETLTFSWVYTTNDNSGSYWDPAGYYDGQYHQLTTDIQGTLGDGDTSGILTLSLLAGQTYGFYVYSSDSMAGRADIDVTAATATPLPAALPLFAGGLGMIGLLGARKRRKAIAA